MRPSHLALIAAAALLVANSASAEETKIGNTPIHGHGLVVSAAYLGPDHLAMAPMLPGMDAPADIHLETDIYADKDFKWGLKPGAWVPYLSITYRITKKGSDWGAYGRSIPMAATDGFHYGNNVKLAGPGSYTLKVQIEPPPYASFYRHTDSEIGVPEWWGPFEASWDFDYPARAAGNK